MAYHAVLNYKRGTLCEVCVLPIRRACMAKEADRNVNGE
jgi:hypothetical protein